MKTSRVNSDQTPAEPIALVGIGCRFPGGAHNPESFWELLKTGSDAIVDIPQERWNLRRFYDADTNKPGKMYVKQGGFLQQRVDEFDALFFGIAPREAECIDPQQRLLLETSWEALEDAGIPYEVVAGSNTGVFIGAFTLDHKLTQMGKMNRHLIGTHTAIGSTMTILSNRISYVLDLRGPSMSLDTACSSSLVALHLACQAIWRGECDLAMAGGVNVMTRPEYPIAMCKGGFLAPDARSKSFDASANGYGRGEGAGVVVLKRLSEALRDGDSIYALVRGTGANQDGRTNGITVPNPESQTTLIRQVCEQYAIDTNDIHYFEAHGTGTPVGDPLEANALGAALGRRDEQHTCLVGSVKATIGHLEAAAGVAGVIKTALCLSHGQVPPQANLNTPNPNIPFAELGLKLPRQLEAFPTNVAKVCAGVNSFGYGGTNAHAILQNAPQAKLTDHAADESGKVYCLPLSARSEEALTDLAKAWLDRFGEVQSAHLSDLGYSAACRRGHHNYRLAIAGASWTEIRGQLQSFAEQGTGEWLASGKLAAESDQKPVFVYTGMGPQWWAMGRELYHNETVYRTAVAECDAIFQRLAGWSILAEMLKDEQNSNITDTTIAQPANFLIQVGLTALWRSLGIEPAAIVGHSVGEVSAAYAAGVLSLEEAVLVSYQRSRIQKKAAGLGKMLAVGLSQEQCVGLLELTNGDVSIAAINSPSSLTLAGEAHSLEAIAAYLTETGEFNRFLQVEVAYHSPFMEPLKPEVRSVLAGLKPQLPKIPLYSTITGDLVTEVLYDAEYWCDNIREPVYFANAMASLLRDGHRIFLEVGPHPVLSTSIKECCRQQAIQPQSFASLRRGKAERLTLNLALAELYVAGCKIDWRQLYSADARYIKLPTYPWQRETYWSENPESKADRVGEPIHPLLDRRLPDPRPTWQSAVNRQLLPYLSDHQVDGLLVMPGAAYVEAGLAAFQQFTGSAKCILEQLNFHQALVLDESGNEQVIHVGLDQDNGEYSFFSRDFDDQLNWRLHASGKIMAADETSVQPINRDAIAGRCGETVNIDKLYSDLAKRGLSYGPYFRSVRLLQRCQGEVLARIELNPALLADNTDYCLHPSLLDGCFQSLIVALEDSDKFYMPVAIKRITYHGKPDAAFWCHGKLTSVNDQAIVGNLSLFDDAGNLLVSVEGLRCRALSSQKEDPIEQLKQWTYAWQWVPQALSSNAAKTGNWLVFSDTLGVGDALCRELEANPGNQVIRVPISDAYPQEPRNVKALSENELNHLRAVMQKAKVGNCVGVAYLWGLEHRVHDDPIGIDQASAALQVIQLLASVFDDKAPRFYMVTEGAQVLSKMDVLDNMAQTPLIGLARVAFNEYPALRSTLVDLAAINTKPNVNVLAQELLADDNEDDVALRGAERYVHRLERLAIEPAVVERQHLNGEDVAAFQIKGQSQAEYHVIALPLAKVGEVVVALDYINLTGVTLNPSDDNDDIPEGYFATGTISAVAEGVSQWYVGDKVVVAAKGKPASHVVCPIERVFSVSHFHTLTDAEVTALTTTLIPAYYALHTIARVAPGEAVLIDAELGASAIAAHTIARWLAARPHFYSNAEGLQLLDGEPVISTKQPDISALLTDNDRVLNVRARVHGANADKQTAIDSLLGLDAHELILADKASNQSAPAKFSRCSDINALKLAFNAPQLFGKLLAEVAQLLEFHQKPLSSAQILSPLEGLAWLTANNAEPKVKTPILSLADKKDIAVFDNNAAPLFDAEAAYLITGGFGGFGLEAAHWLAKRGAKHLVLVGRRGAADENAKAAVQSLERQGVTVQAVAADIADEMQVAGILAQIAKQLPPLRGVLHAAAVLDDAPMSELDPERLARVMKAKALGAWHLHKLTQDHPLEFFMLFSSVSALIGNARQANYVAANTFLDALASHRIASGLPATSINWGAIATGMAVESVEVAKHLELMGMYAITVEQALEAWACLREIDQPQYGLMNCVWPRWQEFEPTGGNSPRFSKLMTAGAAQSNALTELCQAISELPEAERVEAMSHAVSEQLAKILRIPVAKIDLQQSLSQMGVDSLMSAELQATITQVFGVRISTLELMRSQNLIHLANLLIERTILAADNSTPDTQDHEASLVDRMSSDEIDILLNQILLEEEK
ncbi:type I polyketide synthase [Methylomonas albis]|uniref:SDR family NAD(P)-dependent oxidoreductase n=1 Tax=Methylomonas albis TaxID=1854563 RepID=A0ABR9D2L5_9GAMM|nr:type I polyketide synthase [Methylomonas albis]MBD9357362.1 SDR family NAD(P)-dependent oxidoreductase [Methylomonas albis]